MNYIVSTIQYCATVNKPFLRNMLAFADNHNVSKIYLFVMAGKNKDETALATVLLEDPRIEFLYLDKNGKKLNNNLKLHDTQILASQINPLTGLTPKLHRDYSYILPSPKIRYLSIPNTSTYPRFQATTGALTHGNYKLHTAQGRKADLEHQYGFVYVEVHNSRRYTIRQVMALKNGNFHYDREYYRNGAMTDVQPEALILGDWHTGETCPKTRAVTIKMLGRLAPKRAVFHDLFNGHSINHHEMDDNVTRALLWKKEKHVLRNEVAACLKELNYFAKTFGDIQFLVSESNHDIFLSTYIRKRNFLMDGQNAEFASVLFAEMLKEKQEPTLATAMRLIGKIESNVKMLREDEEYRVKGIGLDAHGHRGVNGARGSGASLDRFNMKQITAHEHTPKIYANGMVVGTSTYLKLGYMHGASSHLNAHGILYRDGTYGLISIIH